MSAFHYVYIKEGQIYIDDMPLRGVQGLNVHYDAQGYAEAELRLNVQMGEPTLTDVNRWRKERMVTEEEWNKMMTEKAQELLDGLT